MDCFRDDQIVFNPETVRKNDLYLYMRMNTDTIVGIAQSFVDYQVKIRKMAPVTCLYDPYFDNVFDLIDSLGITQEVTDVMRCMMEEEECAVHNCIKSAI